MSQGRFENQHLFVNHMNSEIHTLSVSRECIGIQSENASQGKYETQEHSKVNEEDKTPVRSCESF